MAKIPKFEDLKASLPGMLDKFKSMLDTIAGPGKSEVTEEALAKETDPLKIKLMEIELLINQLNDIQVIQNRTVYTLRNKHGELLKFFEQQKQAAEAQKSAETMGEDTSNKEDK